MHNVNILTIHKEPNYGAVLQAYALYKTIENLGHVPYIINLDTMDGFVEVTEQMELPF